MFMEMTDLCISTYIHTGYLQTMQLYQSLKNSFKVWLSTAYRNVLTAFMNHCEIIPKLEVCDLQRT